ncbi:MAG: twin-arginine translocation signal domain-containing protein, partial [Raoultibacter sp.]
MTEKNIISEPLHISRRSFLAGTGAMGALAMLGSLGLVGCAPKAEESKGAAPAPGKAESYDIVIVGTGGAGL